jgi:hypothetical protein
LRLRYLLWRIRIGHLIPLLRNRLHLLLLGEGVLASVANETKGRPRGPSISLFWVVSTGRGASLSDPTYVR